MALAQPRHDARDHDVHDHDVREKSGGGAPRGSPLAWQRHRASRRPVMIFDDDGPYPADGFTLDLLHFSLAGRSARFSAGASEALFLAAGAAKNLQLPAQCLAGAMQGDVQR